MNQKKSAPLLLAEDIALEPGREKRAQAVKLCASRLAHRLRTAIDVVHVEDPMLYPIQTPRRRPTIEKLTARNLGRMGILPSKAIFLTGDPVRKILSLNTKKKNYQMNVLGTHGHRGLRRLVMGSVAEEVIRRSRIPVMTVGPEAQKKSSAFLKSTKKVKVLIPTGLTPNSLKAEAYGLKLARRLGAELVFVHSLHETLHPLVQDAFSLPTPSVPMQGFYEEVREASRENLAAKVARAERAGVSASFVLDVRTLSSSSAVLRAAKRLGASLIVMGTHGRSMVSGALFGRTARDVILASQVPVVTVHSRKA